MPNTIITLKGSTVETLARGRDDGLTLRLAPALILKSQGIAGVDPSTRWAQEGEIRIAEADTEGVLPELPALSTGGSIECGGYRYIDMVPLPLDLPGYVELRLRFGDREWVARGQDPRVALEGQARYLEHVQETQPPR
jgi:hypothetical protein